MAAPDPDLPFDLTGCTVTQIEWPRRGFRMILGGKTAEGRAVDGVAADVRGGRQPRPAPTRS